MNTYYVTRQLEAKDLTDDELVNQYIRFSEELIRTNGEINRLLVIEKAGEDNQEVLRLKNQKETFENQVDDLTVEAINRNLTLI